MIPQIQTAKVRRKRSSYYLSDPLFETIAVVTMSLLVGIIAGGGAYLFVFVIDLLYHFFHQALVPLQRSLSPSVVIFLPALGLIIVGLLTNYLGRQVRHGVPQILEAVALRGGRIKPLAGLIGFIAPAIVIGSDGSAGQIGPIAFIGAAAGSLLGQMVRLREKHLTLLLACGAAAGIAAILKVPIAGAFFGMEVVLGNFSMGAVVPLFLAAIAGFLVHMYLGGIEPFFAVPPLVFSNLAEVILALVLGLFSGFVALCFTRGLTFSEDFFERWQVPFWLKALFGGTLVGLLGLAYPQVLGVGYPAMTQVVNEQLPMLTVAALLICKYIATLVTIGVGGSGGVFAPSLYLGVMLGFIFGSGMQVLFPGVVLQPQLFALVGMGAIFAAAAQAPLTASLIILEMTGNYVITAGIMAACAISYLIHGSLIRDSIFTAKLGSQGINILRGTDIRPAERIPVTAAMKKIDTIWPANTTVARAWQALAAGEATYLIVAETRKGGPGIATLHNIRRAMENGDYGRTLGELVDREAIVMTVEQDLDTAMRLFAFNEDTSVLVEDNEGRLVGILSQQDVLRTYSLKTIWSMEPV
ncbi:MAG: chloride channel protein, partial [Clostridia bacterium]|nr:chloride channel protein [Clostridia bacterium]